jgi:hypothetical protein
VSAAADLPPSLVHRLPTVGTHELLGWNLWTAVGALASVDVLRVGDRIEVVLAEHDDWELLGAPRADTADRDSGGSQTRLVLGPDGLCSATHLASPSLLHLPHVGVEVTAAMRDGSRSEVAIEHGDVLMAPTASFLQVAPAALLAQIPMRTRRRRSLAGLADDLVRRVGGSSAGERAGIVVAQRVWPASG